MDKDQLIELELNRSRYLFQRNKFLQEIRAILKELIIPDLSKIVWEYTEPIVECVATMSQLLDYQFNDGTVHFTPNRAFEYGQVRESFVRFPQSLISTQLIAHNPMYRPPPRFTINLSNIPLFLFSNDGQMVFLRILPYQSKLLTLSFTRDFDWVDPHFITIWEKQNGAYYWPDERLARFDGTSFPFDLGRFSNVEDSRDVLVPFTLFN